MIAGFFPLAPHFIKFLLGDAQKSNFSLGFLGFVNFFFPLVSNFSFSDLFAAVIELLLSLLPDKKCLRQHLSHEKFLPWSCYV